VRPPPERYSEIKFVKEYALGTRMKLIPLIKLNEK